MEGGKFSLVDHDNEHNFKMFQCLSNQCVRS